MGFATILMVCVILPMFVAQQTPPERHSLYYVYTALSKAVNAPGIFEFTAMGLLDDRKIDYYNSKDQVKIPEQDWMKKKLPTDYWDKGTQSRKSKEQWFKVNVNILMERMRQNGSDIHVLMWKHGCEVEKMSDGSVLFVKGVDAYSYDGIDFLSFDDVSMQWVAPVSEAVPTKQKWDGVPILNQYTKGYLEKECVDWLTKFENYGGVELKKQFETSPPDVHLFATKTQSQDLKLTCMATGFYPKDIDITILKGEMVVKKGQMEDVMPNGDGTHQIKLSVEAKRSELDDYRCEVNHIGLKGTIKKEWPSNGELVEEDNPFLLWIVLLIVVGVLLVLVITGFIAVKTRVIDVQNGFRFNGFGKPAPPLVRLFTKQSTSPDTVTLTCMASDFSPKYIHITILKENNPVLKGDVRNVTVSEDGTSQIELNVEVKRSEFHNYRCEVNHKGLEEMMQKDWPSVPPLVHLSAKETTPSSPDTVNLTCMATGFSPKHIDITILKRNEPVLQSDVRNVMRNSDGTHQIELNVEAKRSEFDAYRCVVNHEGLEERIERVWPSVNEYCDSESGRGTMNNGELSSDSCSGSSGRGSRPSVASNPDGEVDPEAEHFLDSGEGRGSSGSGSRPSLATNTDGEVDPETERFLEN